MAINWTTGREQAQRQLAKLPRARKVKIRRTIGARGFFHAGQVVAEGEEIECDHDIADSLIAMGKAERA